MSDGKRVSVVIASYNMAKYLSLALRSVLDQTRMPDEIHVVDDGSTDDTAGVMASFAGHDRVVYHRQENGGQARAKNRGIRASSGDYVAFLDADDLWMPRKLELQLPAFDGHPEVGVVYTNFARIDAEGSMLGSPEGRFYSGRISGRLLIENFVTGMASIVRRECFERVGLFDETLAMGIDYDLWLRISPHYDFKFLDEVTYSYRQWPGQMSHNYRKRMQCAIFIMERFLKEHPGLVEARTVREAWAHTFVSRGACAVSFDRDRRGALRDYLRALRFRPSYIPAWKAIAKLALGSAGD